MGENKSNFGIFIDGIIKQNPVLVLLVGMCPTLAVTTMAVNGVGMGIATTFVLVFSSVTISILKRFIPDSVRLPIYIIVIASFVTITQLLVKRYFPDLDKALGVYLELITVNCLIFMRAESFAGKNNPLKSAIDGLGYGIGFTAALIIIGTVREILGMGKWFGVKILPDFIEPMAIFIHPSGGFFAFGFVIAVIFCISKKINSKRELKTHSGCESCGMCKTPRITKSN